MNPGSARPTPFFHFLPQGHPTWPLLFRVVARSHPRFIHAGARMAAVNSDLAAKACVPCRGGVPPLKGEELASLQRQVDGWNVIEEHHITKAFKFPDFREALKFVNRVGELAEEQRHHPDIFLAWGKVEVTTWTHKINGLTESDFILGAKIDKLYKL